MRLVGWSPPPAQDVDRETRARAARVRRRAVAARWRRPLAALLVAAAVVAALAALRPPGAATVAVLVAADDLSAGATVRAGDLRSSSVPPAAVPPSAVQAGRPDRVVGGVLAGAVGRGEMVTTARLLGPGLLTGAPPGTLAVPVEVSTTLPAGALRAGDAVAVIVGARDEGSAPGAAQDAGATGPSGRLLVDRCVVLMPPQAASAGSGLLSGGGGGAPVAVLALSAAQAQAVADAGADGPLLLGVLPR